MPVGIIPYVNEAKYPKKKREKFGIRYKNRYWLLETPTYSRLRSYYCSNKYLNQYGPTASTCGAKP